MERRQHAGVFSAKGPFRDETVPTHIDGSPGTCAEERLLDEEEERAKEREAEEERGRDKR